MGREISGQGNEAPSPAGDDRAAVELELRARARRWSRRVRWAAWAVALAGVAAWGGLFALR